MIQRTRHCIAIVHIPKYKTVLQLSLVSEIYFLGGVTSMYPSHEPSSHHKLIFLRNMFTLNILIQLQVGNYV